jgi:hypothetical protein
VLNSPFRSYQNLPFKTYRTVPRHFWQNQNTFGDPRTLLTANFTFGICRSVLESAKHSYKPQKSAGTVPALFAPFKTTGKRPSAANTGTAHFTPPQIGQNRRVKHRPSPPLLCVLRVFA